MMMLSRMKSLDDLLDSLGGERRLLLLGCNGCEESFGNAEPERLRRLGTDLDERGRVAAELEKAADPLSRSIQIAADLVREARGFCQGVHLMNAGPKTAERVLREAGLTKRNGGAK
jgi:hypothetical protein